MVAGDGEDYRNFAGRIAADSGEGRNGSVAADEANGNRGTGRRLGNTARAQQVTNRGAKVVEVTVGDDKSQLGEGGSACACQATCNDPGVLRVAGGNRGPKLGSGGSARAM